MGLRIGQTVPADWWIPGQSEDNVIPGTCEITKEGGIVAKLHRNPLRSAGQASLLAAPLEDIPLLHGSIFGTPVTLVDCRMGPATTKFTAQADIELRPWLALEGLLLGDEELVVSEAQVRLRHQRIWASWSPFFYEFEESSLQPKRLAYHAPAGRVTAIPGGTLSIEDDSIFWPRPQQGDAEIKSQCKFVVSLDSPLPLRDFLPQYILPLETLISLATTSIARIESLHVTDKSWIASATESGRSNLLKVWFGRSPSQDDFRDITSQDLLFLLSDYRWEEVGGNLFSILPNWRYIIDQWITLINRNYRWPIPRFLTAVTI
ncbi:hypothetical protein, partial [Microbispora sp. CSR-4]|uniref:ApeA N-terminal domain 1-containing protein n=1 Tax=Microbispora sp. CSR-4 TaxID=2592813 RepID=UPI00164FE325